MATRSHFSVRLVVRLFLAFAVLALNSPSLCLAQENSTGPSHALATAGASSTQDAGPQRYQPPPAVAAAASAFARAEHRLYFADFVWGILVLMLLIRWRLGPRFRGWAERSGRNGFLQALIFSPCLIVTIDVLSFPFRIYGHSLSRKYHMSIEDWPSWLLDRLKEEAIGVAIAILAVWIFYAIVRKSPKRWWLYSWLALLPVLVFLVFVTPVLIEPLFFEYRPLAQAQPTLSAQIEQLARHSSLDIPANRIFEMTASAKLNSVNAYVTGVGASKRGVIWDTTIAKMSPPEILFTVGHEMGHYVLHHVWKGMAAAAAAILVFLFAAYHMLWSFLGRTGGRWGIRGPGDLASLPVLLLLLSMFGFLLTPVGNAVSRYIEHQADQFGLEVIHGVVPNPSGAAASAFELLGEVDLEAPNPTWFEKQWFYDHPPLDERIRFARSYDPWSKGESPEFVK
ncbi:MAG TPA: M48 family metallopeptidase [Methylomirabilota bacterium]|nr:M48 family metallopeptidase [Methylomirabilota bacterium]